MVSDEGASAEFFDLVRAKSIIGRLPLRRIAFYTRTLSMDEGARVAWRDEGAAYTTSPLKLTNQTGLAPFEVGALIVVTARCWKMTASRRRLIVRDQLVKALAVAVDRDSSTLTNSGTAGVKPASVTSGAAASTRRWRAFLRATVTLATRKIRGFCCTQCRLLAGRMRTGPTSARMADSRVAPGGDISAVPDEIVSCSSTRSDRGGNGNAEIRTSEQASVDMAELQLHDFAPTSCRCPAHFTFSDEQRRHHRREIAYRNLSVFAAGAVPILRAPGSDSPGS